ncbi:MAG: transposase [Candidatus Marinimicrobia bacterium]|nr:transposase [Candidatus Neomarinimicrobiota bacterium]
MAYIIGEKNQNVLFPPIIDDHISKNDPVRVYDAFVDDLDLKELGIEYTLKPGAPEYFPKTMLKLALYGPSYGIFSSRKLERATHHNLSFIWLMNNLKPDYRTIARFRLKNAKAIKKILKQCVRLCIEMDLIEGNTLFIDGSKFRANAGIGKTRTKESLEKELKKIDEKIDQLIDECTKIDKQEESERSHVQVKEEIKNKQDLAQSVKDLMKKLESSDKKNINMTDPDSVKAKTRQGIHSCHNVQVATDKKHGLIVSAEAVSQNNDLGQLSNQIENAIENFGKKPENVCTDAGYFDSDDFTKIDKDITVVVPSVKQTKEERSSEPKNPFDKDNFKYDKEQNGIH